MGDYTDALNAEDKYRAQQNADHQSVPSYPRFGEGPVWTADSEDPAERMEREERRASRVANLVDEAIAKLDPAVDLLVDAHRRLVDLHGEHDAVLLMHTMIVNGNPGWTRSKLATLTIGLVRRVESLQAQLNGEPPF